MPVSREDWKRVGSLLAERRAEIDDRYASRKAFAEATGLNWRTIYDAEKGARANFTPRTVRQFETAYRLARDSLSRSLAGGPLEPLPVLAAVPRPPQIPGTGDVADEVIALLLERDPDRKYLKRIWLLPDETREERLDMIRVWLRRDEPAPTEEGRTAGPASLISRYARLRNENDLSIPLKACHREAPSRNN